MAVDGFQTAIHSIEVDMESERQPLMSANGNMRFGVAAVSEEGMTTGIVVTECIYDPDRGDCMHISIWHKEYESPWYVCTERYVKYEDRHYMTWRYVNIRAIPVAHCL